MTLRSPCRSAPEYWLFLDNEFNSWANAYVTNEANAAKKLRWTSVMVANQAEAPGEFLRMLGVFAALMASHLNGPLVLSLLPSEGTDAGTFGRFLFLLLSQPLPSRLRLLVRDDVAKPTLDSLAKSLGKAMHTQFMDMRLPEYVTKITSGGDPNEPSNKIRAYQKELALALAPNQKDIPEAERIAVHSLKLCDEQKWHSLAASIHIALAYAYFEEKKDKGSYCALWSGPRHYRTGLQKRRYLRRLYQRDCLDRDGRCDPTRWPPPPNRSPVSAGHRTSHCRSGADYGRKLPENTCRAIPKMGQTQTGKRSLRTIIYPD